MEQLLAPALPCNLAVRGGQAWHVTSTARLKPSACCQYDALRHCFWPPYWSQQFCKRCGLEQMSQALGCQLTESFPCKICLHLGWQHSMSVAGKVDSRGLGESEMEETVVWERLKQAKRFENTVSLCQLTTCLGLSSFPLGSQTCMSTLRRSVLLPSSLWVTFLCCLQLPASPSGKRRAECVPALFMAGKASSQILVAETTFQPEMSTP